MEDQAVKYFREYLRIPSVHPNIDYSECVSFLKRLAEENGLISRVLGKARKPIVVLTWPGTERDAGSILLNSHMDVVPVCRERWTYDPFKAVKDSHGNIYGRGAQDTKCLGIQQVAAVRRLMLQGIRLKRTVHISFVPDEEIGGAEGMGSFVKTKDFKMLNVAFAFDEGEARPDDVFVIENEERTPLKIKIHCNGPTGHGSLFHLNTAGEKVRRVLDGMMDYRATQVALLEEVDDRTAKLAELNTINLTEIEGGVQNNVVPAEIVLGFDVRISINEDHDKFYRWIESVCEQAGEGVYCEYTMKNPKIPKTVLDSTNKFWVAIQDTLTRMNLKHKQIACFGSTDGRYLRQIGVPCIGFSPMRCTPLLLHCDDEFLNENIFLEGVDILFNILEAVANV